MSTQIEPHGGKLINRIAEGDVRYSLQEKAMTFKGINLNSRQLSDVEMIAIGAFSPLEGFLNKDDYESVLEEWRLNNGLVWSIPITLAVDREDVKDLAPGKDVALWYEKELVGVLHLEDVYTYDKEREAQLVYKTTDINHPGVAYLYKQGEFLLGGKVTLINTPSHGDFADYWLTPFQSRQLFKDKGWRTIVGFQTRNPIHRAHEYIIKTALEIVDGLFLNPLVGETKKGDIPAPVRMACYNVLLERYFPKERAVLAVYGAAMRYAGPREAILHALVRKNFGCTHFIVGRDHAGVGNYYGPFEAQKIFDRFSPAEIGIIPLFFENAFWCRRCGGMATLKTCPHPEEEHFSLSGTRVRELLSNGEIPPPEFTRPEIANILLCWFRGGGG